MINFLLISLLAICDIHGLRETSKMATPGQFNYFAMVLHRGEFHCGGTIIDQRHIIARGSCVMNIPNSDLSIMVGTVDTKSLKTPALEVESVHIHDGFKTVRDRVIPGEIHWEHDIAVLKLVNQMVFNPFTAPAVLITGEYNWNVGLECVVPGWRQLRRGTTSMRLYIRWSEAKTYIDEDCIRAGVILLKNEKCAYWRSGSYQNMIHSWSSSPMVHGNTVIGIADNRNRKKFYTFLNLLPYKDFIAYVTDDRKYDVSPQEVRYVVSIWDQGNFKCGGIILGASHVFTTGYCVQYTNNTNLQVVAGHTQVLENDPRIQWLSVDNIEIHPGYEEIIHVDGPKSLQIKNNYALLTLAVPLEGGPTIGSVPLSNRHFVFTSQVCKAFRWHNTYTVDDKVLLQLIWSQEFIMDPEVCRKAGVNLEADEICVNSQYVQNSTNLVSSGNPVVCEGFVIGIIIPNFSTSPQVSSLTSVLSISPFINSLNDVCYRHPT